MTLPTPTDFLAEFGLGPKPQPEPQQHEVVRKEVQKFGVSPEFLDLIVNYCANQREATQLSEVRWGSLARALGTGAEHLEEAANLVESQTGGKFWLDVMGQRIKRVGAHEAFRNGAWERLEASAVNRLLILAEKNMIKDTGELLAIATHARKVNQGPAPAAGGTTVNVNLGGEQMGENGLPAAGARMTIDLSARTAASLAQKRAESQGRVIDGEMLSAQELRDALQNKQLAASTESEGEDNE